MLTSYVRIACCLLVCAVLVGCSGEEAKEMPATVPVSGVVTYNGSAVEGAQVSLQPTASDGKPAQGTTDSGGAFTVSTYVSGTDYAEGALQGGYTVTVQKVAASGDASASMEDMMRAQQEGNETGPANELPEKYASAATSGFTATVGPNGTADLKLDLTD